MTVWENEERIAIGARQKNSKDRRNMREITLAPQLVDKFDSNIRAARKLTGKFGLYRKFFEEQRPGRF